MTTKEKATAATVAQTENVAKSYYRKNHEQSTKKRSGLIIGIADFDEFYQGVPVISYVRISRPYSDAAMQRYFAEQRDTIKDAGHPIYETVQAIEKRWKIVDRPGLKSAVRLAQATGYGIIVQDVTRLVGHKNPHKPPSSKRIRRLLRKYPAIFVVVDPVEDIKRNRTLKGQAATANKGGGDRKAGWSCRRRNRLRFIVWTLRFDENRGIREIERIIKQHCHTFGMKSVSRQTISRWCR